MNNTKTCYLDANILVFYKESSSDQHGQAVAIIEKLVGNDFTLFTSPLALDEFLFTGLYYLRKKKAKDIKSDLKDLLSSILKIPNLKIINPPEDLDSQLKIVDYIVDFSLRPRDAYHLFAIKSHKIRYFATLDKDFDKVFDKGVVKNIK